MFDQEKWAEHLQKLKPFILTSLVIFAGLIVMVKTTRTGGKSKVQDYFAVNLAMDAWNQNPSDENWLALRNKLDSHPELYKKFGGHIAQKFLYAGKDSPIEFETKEVPSPYNDFFQLTKMVHAKKYSQALTEAVALKGRLQSDNSFPTLYVFNLVQIASLQKTLGKIEDENESWKEVQELLGKDQRLIPIAAHFQKGSAKLQDYIRYREETIKAKN